MGRSDRPDQAPLYSQAVRTATQTGTRTAMCFAANAERRIGMRSTPTRRQVLKWGLLTALGAGLASCDGMQRLADTPSPEPPTAATPPPTLVATRTPAPTPTASPAAIDPALASNLFEARYYVELEADRVQCQMCFRRCIVAEGARGFCRNKVNIGGRYYTLVYGRPSALQLDPIEKEPHKLVSLPATPIETLESAAQVADEVGLQYIYIGNVPGHERNSTFCPACGEKIVGRSHFTVTSLDVISGKCRFCGQKIPGVWRNA